MQTSVTHTKWNQIHNYSEDIPQERQLEKSPLLLLNNGIFILNQKNTT